MPSGTSKDMIVPVGSRKNPCLSWFASTYDPVMAPFALMPKACVEMLPGGSIEVIFLFC